MELYNPIKDQLERYCLAITRNREDAKDLLSETILQTYSRIDSIKDKSKFPNYIFRVAKRIDIKMKKKISTTQSLDTLKIEKKDTNSNVDIRLDIKIMYEALSKLSIKLKQAVILYEISGFSMKEIAEIEECSLSAAKIRVMRGRNELTGLLLDKNLNTN